MTTTSTTTTATTTTTYKWSFFCVSLNLTSSLRITDTRVLCLWSTTRYLLINVIIYTNLGIKNKEVVKTPTGNVPSLTVTSGEHQLFNDTSTERTADPSTAVMEHLSQAPHTEKVVTGMTPVRSNCDVLANGTGEILQMILLLLLYDVWFHL